MMPSVFSWLFGIFLYFVSLLLFARDWVSFRELLKKLPFASPVSRAGKRVSSALKNWAHGQVRIMFIVALECAVGFWLLRIPGAGLWAVLTGFRGCASGLRHRDSSFSPGSFVELLRQRNLDICPEAFPSSTPVTWLTRELLEPGLSGRRSRNAPSSLLSDLRHCRVYSCFGPVRTCDRSLRSSLLSEELWAELRNSGSTSYVYLSAPSADDEKTCVKEQRQSCSPLFAGPVPSPYLASPTMGVPAWAKLYPDLMMASSEQMNSYQTSVFPLPHYFILQLAALASFGPFFHHPGHVGLSRLSEDNPQDALFLPGVFHGQSPDTIFPCGYDH